MTSDIVNARILELEDQVADNNDRAERYRMWFKAAIHQLRELAFQTDYQQNNIIQKNQTIRELRAEVAHLKNLQVTPPSLPESGRESPQAWLQ